MDSAIIHIVEREADSFIGRVNANMRNTGTDATGKTSQEFSYVIGEKDGSPTVDLTGRPFFATVETGRRPTPGIPPSRAMIENIEDWVQARGIPEDAVWGIAINIQNKGTELWRNGGRKDIYSNEIPPFVDKLTKSLADYYADQIVKSLENI